MPDSLTYNLRAEADMLDQYLNDCAPSNDPSAFRINDSDLQRIAKTMRCAAGILSGNTQERTTLIAAIAFALGHPDTPTSVSEKLRDALTSTLGKDSA